MSKSSLLSSMTSGTPQKGESDRHIITLSGGVASAWVAHWARLNLPKDKTVYYFNDTLWEHHDLYRFLRDLEGCLDIEIYRDNDGRNPEQVFYDQKMLGSNRVPICSKILKAHRLQEFVIPGDTVYFGIDIQEIHRAARITPIYERFGCHTRFPIIEGMITRNQIFETIKDYGIKIPQMYKDGFTHNNCAGGCVRAGKRQWVMLYKTYPEIYADRERIEREFTEWNNNRRYKKAKKENTFFEWREHHFMKDISLKQLREQIEADNHPELFDDDEWQGECVGICGRMY